MILKNSMVKKIKQKSKFTPPVWWDCQWRRVPCGKESCAMCGRIGRARTKHILRGEDPDSVESVLADVKDNFEETFTLLEKSAKKFGVDIHNLPEVEFKEPPDISNSPICIRLQKLYKFVINLEHEATEGFQIWPKLEAGKDLLWYPSIILVKVKRLFNDRWKMGNGDEYIKDDFDYTFYVISESINILKSALMELISKRTHQKVQFSYCYDELESLEKLIFKI
jgi:hypothetical protein